MVTSGDLSFRFGDVNSRTAKVIHNRLAREVPGCRLALCFALPRSAFGRRAARAEADAGVERIHRALLCFAAAAEVPAGHLRADLAGAQRDLRLVLARLVAQRDVLVAQTVRRRPWRPGSDGHLLEAAPQPGVGGGAFRVPSGRERCGMETGSAPACERRAAPRARGSAGTVSARWDSARRRGRGTRSSRCCRRCGTTGRAHRGAGGFQAQVAQLTAAGAGVVGDACDPVGDRELRRPAGDGEEPDLLDIAHHLGGPGVGLGERLVVRRDLGPLAGELHHAHQHHDLVVHIAGVRGPGPRRGAHPGRARSIRAAADIQEHGRCGSLQPASRQRSG